jgi:hypothetical protein
MERSPLSSNHQKFITGRSVERVRSGKEKAEQAPWLAAHSGMS